MCCAEHSFALVYFVRTFMAERLLNVLKTLKAYFAPTLKTSDKMLT